MSLIASPCDSVIINMCVIINLNASSSLGMIRYTNLSTRMPFLVSTSDSR